MAVNSPRAQNPSSGSSSLSSTPSTSPGSSPPGSPRAGAQSAQPLLAHPEADQFKSSASHTHRAFSSTAAPRFGDGDSPETPKEKPGFLRKTFSTTLGVLSGIGLAIGVPLGLLQMAVGIIFHPLLITGLLTMAIPAAGMLGAWLLGREK